MWTSPTTKVDVVCGGFYYFSSGMAAFTNSASDFTMTFGNGREAAKLGTSELDILANMEVSCREKVRRVFLVSDDMNWYMQQTQGAGGG